MGFPFNLARAHDLGINLRENLRLGPHVVHASRALGASPQGVRSALVTLRLALEPGCLLKHYNELVAMP